METKQLASLRQLLRAETLSETWRRARSQAKGGLRSEVEYGHIGGREPKAPVITKSCRPTSFAVCGRTSLTNGAGNNTWPAKTLLRTSCAALSIRQMITDKLVESSDVHELLAGAANLYDMHSTVGFKDAQYHRL